MADEDKGSGIQVIFFVFFSLLVGSSIRSSFRRSSLPYTVILLLFGLLLGTVEHLLNEGELGVLSLSVREVSNIEPHLLFAVFLPALIFESSFSVHYHTMSRELGQAFLLAGPGVIISAGLTACVARFFPYNWSWNVSLMFGFMLSATDPVAVVALLREIGASKRLGTLIEAESLLNDGTAFVFFILLQDREIGQAGTLLQEVGKFIQLSAGGVALGLISGATTTYWIAHTFKDFEVETSITLISSYLTFYVAENILGVSGVLATVFLGLMIAKYRTVVSVEVEHGLHHVWQMVAYMANTLIFILSGIIVANKFFDDFIQWRDAGLLLVLYIAIHIIRAASILSLLPWMNRVGYTVSTKDVVVLVQGGLRGAVGLSLALLVELSNIEPEISSRIVFQTAGIVFLTLFVDASTMKPILQHLGLDKQKPAAMKLTEEAMKTVNRECSSLFVTLTDDRHFRGADWQAVKNAQPILQQTQAHNISRQTKNGPSSTEAAGVLHTSIRRRRTSQKKSNNSSYDDLSSSHTTSEERVEIQRRFMLGMRAMVLLQLEEGLTSSTAARLLVAAVDEGLDTEDLAGVWTVIEPQFDVSQWVERLYAWTNSPIITRALVILVLRPRLSLAIEIATGYINASKRASDNLRDFQSLVKRNTYCEVMREVMYYEAKTRAKWVQVQVGFPEVYRAIQTRHASDYLLHRQGKHVEHLFGKGLIEQKEFDEMMSTIDEAVHVQHRSKPFLRRAEISGDLQTQDFRHLKIISHLPNKIKDRVAAASELLSYSEGETLFNNGEVCRGLYVIISGVIEVRIAGRDDDSFEWYGSGSNIGAWPLLTNGKHFETARANKRTQVNVLLIPPHVVEALMSDDEVEARLWKQVGANLTKRYFRSIFRSSALMELTRMCDEGRLFKPTPLCHVEITSPAILLLGYVAKGEAQIPLPNDKSWESKMNRRESVQSYDAQAPVLLLPSWYVFSHNAKLLVLPDELEPEWSRELTAARMMNTSELNTIVFPIDADNHDVKENTGPRLKAVLHTLREALPNADNPRASKIVPGLLVPDIRHTQQLDTHSSNSESHREFNESIYDRIADLNESGSITSLQSTRNSRVLVRCVSERRIRVDDNDDITHSISSSVVRSQSCLDLEVLLDIDIDKRNQQSNSQHST